VSSQLSTAVCSITPTQRRRYFWAAWWTGAPTHAPFRRPDAANGGARTFEEALHEAQVVAGRRLTVIEPYWARAWKSVLRGLDPAPPPVSPDARSQRAAASAQVPAARANPSAWSVLGLAPGASLAEVKRAFQRRALETHPDQGGEAEHFRAVQRAYEKLVERLAERPRVKR
jgi:DnaJ domain